MGSGEAEEYRVKAAFIYHFMQLVDWRDENFDDSPTIEVCTVGEDRFQGELENAMNGKTVHSRSINVRHLHREADLSGCEVVYLDGDDRKLARSAIEALKGRPVLTIGDGDTFLQDGGMIRFLMEDNKIRFEINLNASQKAQLKISSRLLLLAKTVIGKPGV